MDCPQPPPPGGAENGQNLWQQINPSDSKVPERGLTPPPRYNILFIVLKKLFQKCGNNMPLKKKVIEQITLGFLF